jgi:hypothetical protein
MFWRINKSVSCMEDAQIIDVLDIALLEIQAQGVFLPKEMKCVKSLCLSLCNRRDVDGAWKPQESSEQTAGILNDNFGVVVK